MKILLFSILLTILTVTLHGLGTHLALTYGTRLAPGAPPGRLRTGGRMALVVVTLLLSHLLEAGIWAAAYYLEGTLADLPTALYYSLTCYSTVGFGDVVLPAPARMLGPIESVVGVLMLGWSTAVIVTVVEQMHRPAHQADRRK